MFELASTFEKCLDFGYFRQSFDEPFESFSLLGRIKIVDQSDLGYTKCGWYFNTTRQLGVSVNLL